MLTYNHFPTSCKVAGSLLDWTEVFSLHFFAAFGEKSLGLFENVGPVNCSLHKANVERYSLSINCHQTCVHKQQLKSEDKDP